MNLFINAKKSILKIGILLHATIGFGQTPSTSINDAPKHQIGIQHDNDFLSLSDRYYSSGLFLWYTKRLENALFNSGHEQLQFMLSQEIYTPAELTKSNLAELDRPYAGFSGVSLGWSLANTHSILETQLLLGVAGKASGAGAFHRWYHSALDFSSPPTWAHELANSFHSNLYVSYSKEWPVITGDFSIHFALQPKIAFGTKDIYAHPEVAAYFGRRAIMSESMAFNQIGTTTKEMFFAFRAGYRFVNHNAMIQGNVFGDDSVFTLDPNSPLFYFGFDFKHRFGQNDYWFGYRRNSAETQTTRAHRFVTLSYARQF